VPEQLEASERLAQQVKTALEAADLAAFSDLLDPDVHWGPPDDPPPPCQNRDQVLSWYRRGRQAGVRARVSETVVLGDRILVGLRVAGNQAAEREARQTGGRFSPCATAVLSTSSGSMSEARQLLALGSPPFLAGGLRPRNGRSLGMAWPMTRSGFACLFYRTPRRCMRTRPKKAASTGPGFRSPVPAWTPVRH
jgi:ketosteroid isomerase-like protein